MGLNGASNSHWNLIQLKGAIENHSEIYGSKVRPGKGKSRNGWRIVQSNHSRLLLRHAWDILCVHSNALLCCRAIVYLHRHVTIFMHINRKAVLFACPIAARYFFQKSKPENARRYDSSKTASARNNGELKAAAACRLSCHPPHRRRAYFSAFPMCHVFPNDVVVYSAHVSIFPTFRIHAVIPTSRACNEIDIIVVMMEEIIIFFHVSGAFFVLRNGCVAGRWVEYAIYVRVSRC